MPKFTSVVTWPPTGWPQWLMDGPDTGPAKDALLRAGRPISELYSESLRTLGLSGYRSTLYIVPQTAPHVDRSEVHLSVLHGIPHDVPGEYGFIVFSPEITPLTVPARARLVLESIHLLVQRLCEVRGWDPQPFEACRSHVIESKYEFAWASDWKASPDRRHEARAEYRLPLSDGWGFAQLVIRDRATHEVIGESPSVRAPSTWDEFKTKTRTLRWASPTEVGLDTSPSLLSHAQIQAKLASERCEFSTRDDVVVREPDGPWGRDHPDSATELPELVVIDDR